MWRAILVCARVFFCLFFCFFFSFKIEVSHIGHQELCVCVRMCVCVMCVCVGLCVCVCVCVCCDRGPQRRVSCVCVCVYVWVLQVSWLQTFNPKVSTTRCVVDDQPSGIACHDSTRIKHFMETQLERRVSPALSTVIHHTDDSTGLRQVQVCVVILFVARLTWQSTRRPP